jgi:hypothetical protein
MYKILVLIFFLAIGWAGLSAQPVSHVVYLKNGWVLHGKVLLNTVDSFKIETCCGNIFVFKPSDVVTIETEPTKSHQKKTQGDLSQSKNGIYNLNSFGLIFGKSDVMESPGYSLKTQIGYQFSNYAGLALGVGIEKYNIETVPVFVSFKSELMKRENTPVIALYLGYAFPMKNNNSSGYYENSYKGGLCAGFDVGICSYKTQNRALYLSAGYQYQHLVEKSSTIWYTNSVTKNSYDFNKLVVKIGYLFK